MKYNFADLLSFSFSLYIFSFYYIFLPFSFLYIFSFPSFFLNFYLLTLLASLLTFFSCPIWPYPATLSMWKKIKSIVDKYIYWQINKRTSSCYMRSAIIVTTTGEEKILFSNTATTECWYKLIPLSNLVIAILGKLSFALFYIFLCFMLRFWFTASKFFLKIINPSCIVSHIGKIFPPEMVWHWHGFLVHQSWMLSEISSTLCPTFLDCFFFNNFFFLLLNPMRDALYFPLFGFLRDFCSLSESISWVDYMRIALVFFQNIECATYALETS